MNAKEEILARIRRALKDAPADAEVTYQYGQPRPMPSIIDQFVSRVIDYKAVVEQVAAPDVGAAIQKALTTAGITSVVIPDGLDAGWKRAIVELGSVAVTIDDPSVTRTELNAIQGVVTAARVGVAETGTIVLDHGPDQGRRAISLVPDYLLCVIGADQIVSDVPEAVVRLRPSIDAGRPLTWISGPSATSDIELQRVEGVHGPRKLVVLVVR